MLWRDAGLPIPLAAAATLGVGARGRRPERPADHAAAAAAADRHARLVLAVPRPGRGAHAAASTTSPTFPTSFLFLGQGYLLGGVPAQLPIFAGRGGRLLGAAAPHDDRPRAVSRSASRPRARATPASRSSGGSALVYVLSGLVAEPGGDHLRRPPRPGQGRRRHGLRAARDHRRRAGRHVDLRRPRQRSTGTLLGLFAIAVLQNGLRLADLPGGAGRHLDRRACCWSRSASSGLAPRRAAAASPAPHPRDEEFEREEFASGRDLRR